MWGGIGGMKISNKGKQVIGQIDIFLCSNSYDDNIFYLGNYGKPHIWENKHFRKENLFPLKFIEFKFPTIEKIVEIPSPRNAEPELIRHFGNDFKHTVPKKYDLWYKIENLLY